MTSWQATQAKAKFSEVLDKASSEGPQLVKRRGTTYVLSTEDAWRERTKPKQNLVDFLLCPPSDGVEVEFPRLKGKLRPVHF